MKLFKKLILTMAMVTIASSLTQAQVILDIDLKKNEIITTSHQRILFSEPQRYDWNDVAEVLLDLTNTINGNGNSDFVHNVRSLHEVNKTDFTTSNCAENDPEDCSYTKFNSRGHILKSWDTPKRQKRLEQKKKQREQERKRHEQENIVKPSDYPDPALGIVEGYKISPEKVKSKMVQGFYRNQAGEVARIPNDEYGKLMAYLDEESAAKTEELGRRNRALLIMNGEIPLSQLTDEERKLLTGEIRLNDFLNKEKAARQEVEKRKKANEDIHAKVRQKLKKHFGSFTDERDGQKYETIKMGDQIWMWNNLNYNIKGSFCFENNPEICNEAGRLYSWESAKEACPAGWKLPHRNDFLTLLKFLETLDTSSINKYDYFGVLVSGYIHERSFGGAGGYEISSSYWASDHFLLLYENEAARLRIYFGRSNPTGAHVLESIKDRDDWGFSIRCIRGKIDVKKEFKKNYDPDDDGYCTTLKFSSSEERKLAKKLCEGLDECPEEEGVAPDGCSKKTHKKLVRKAIKHFTELLDNDEDGFCTPHEEYLNSEHAYEREAIQEVCQYEREDECPNQAGVSPTGCPASYYREKKKQKERNEEIRREMKKQKERNDIKYLKDQAYKKYGYPDSDGDGVCDAWVRKENLETAFENICKGVDKCPKKYAKTRNGCPDKGRDAEDSYESRPKKKKRKQS